MALTKVTGGTISTTSNYEVGVITATKFVGPFEGAVTGVATGASKVITSVESSDTTCFPLFVNSSTDAYQAPKLGSNLTFNSSTGDLGATKVTAEQFVGNISGTGATFTTLEVSGTLNYTHVTDVYSVGVGTFASNVQVGAGISVVGVSTFTNGVGIADSIFHTGDTNTAIKFDTDKIKLEAGGSEKLRAVNDGVVITGVTTFSASSHVSNANGSLFFGDGNATAYGTQGGIGRASHHNYHIGSSEPGDLCIAAEGSKRILFGTKTGTGIGGIGLKMLIASGGQVAIGTTIEGHGSADNLTIADSGNGGITIRTGDTSNGAIFFSDATSGDAEYHGFVQYNHGTDPYMLFGTSGDERLRIRGDGNINAQKSLAVGGITTSSGYDLSTIDKDISDTAVDIFVYDTRKDSDGGAWRNRTSHTSWYNETLNTSTRGARKQFPAVAVIVIENGGQDEPVITIYDGDDPNLPMWMVFHTRNAAGGDDQRLSENYYAAGPYPIRKVAMLNGIMVDCQYRSAGHAAGTVKGVTRYNFIKDSSIMMTDEGTFKRNGDLGSERNTLRSYTKISTTDIVHTQCNDVAMTVLPNAPIDAFTGLPIPTIAVATDGGVSVLKDDGTVIDGTSTSGSNYSQTKQITFTEENYLWWLGDYFGGGANLRDSYALSLDTVPNSNFTWANDTDNLSVAGDYYAVSTGGELGDIKIGFENTWAWNIQERNALGGPSGLAIHKPNIDSKTKSLIAAITSDYNTGWMQGDIKGAFLSDTDTTNITGTNLYLDNFSNNDKGWTFADNGSDGIASGVMTIANNGSARATDVNALTGVATGTKISVTFTVTFGGTGQLNLDDDGAGAGVGGNTNLLIASKSGSGTQTFSAIYTKTASDRVRFIRSSGGNFTIDNFVMKILPVDDRSVKNNGLAVYGTITKNPVATGAELVSYSSFSTSNRLEQPYNSDLTFGTDDFSIMFWVKHDGTDAHQTIVGREDREFNIFLLSKSSYSRRIRVYAHDSSDSVQLIDSTDYPYPINSWTHICVNYTGGNKAAIYIDGVLDSSGALDYDIDDTSHKLYVGVRNDDTNANVSFPAANCELALLRISKSAPSEEQIKKMYNDEKHLFNVNAKATLYGSSDTVTALAFDDSHDILHVGTSAGRSEFRGLNRINNTTTAVTTAISASNELVAEQ